MTLARAFPAPRWSDLRRVDLDELAHRAQLDDLDELALEPGPVLEALLAGAWMGVRVMGGAFALAAAAGVALDRLRARR